jgi:hypothetical protein
MCTTMIEKIKISVSSFFFFKNRTRREDLLNHIIWRYLMHDRTARNPIPRMSSYIVAKLQVDCKKRHNLEDLNSPESVALTFCRSILVVDLDRQIQSRWGPAHETIWRKIKRVSLLVDSIAKRLVKFFATYTDFELHHRDTIVLLGSWKFRTILTQDDAPSDVWIRGIGMAFCHCKAILRNPEAFGFKNVVLVTRVSRWVDQMRVQPISK